MIFDASRADDFRQWVNPADPPQDWILATKVANDAFAGRRFESAQVFYLQAHAIAQGLLRQSLSGESESDPTHLPGLFVVSVANLADNLCHLEQAGQAARLAQNALQRFCTVMRAPHTPVRIRYACERHLSRAVLELTPFLDKSGLNAEIFDLAANAKRDAAVGSH